MMSSTWISLALTASLSVSPTVSPQAMEQLIQTGTIASQKQLYVEVEAALRNTIKREPKNVNAYIQLGDTLTYLSHHGECEIVDIAGTKRK